MSTNEPMPQGQLDAIQARVNTIRARVDAITGNHSWPNYPWPGPANEPIKELEKENAELHKRLTADDAMVERAAKALFLSSSRTNTESETEMNDHLHHITHTHDAGYGIRTKFTCTGDRAAFCHVYPDCDCAFLMEECTHTPTQHDECWAEGWMTDADCAEECGPDGEPVRSGPINVTWNGDCVSWEYAEDTAA